MEQYKECFDSEAEALAFEKGLTFVGDESITVTAIYPRSMRVYAGGVGSEPFEQWVVEFQETI